MLVIITEFLFRFHRVYLWSVIGCFFSHASVQHRHGIVLRVAMKVNMSTQLFVSI